MKTGSTLLRAFACAAAVAFLAAGSAFAAEVNLTAVTFPDGKTIDIPMARTNAATNAAMLEAAVNAKAGQSEVTVSFKKMEPALLFGGDVSSYVVWAVTRDGAVENLGELIVDQSNDSGSGKYRTGKKQFALMVTAEPYYLVGKPGEVVIATSMAADPKKAASAPFVFSGFRTMAAKVGRGHDRGPHVQGQEAGCARAGRAGDGPRREDRRGRPQPDRDGPRRRPRSRRRRTRR